MQVKELPVVSDKNALSTSQVIKSPPTRKITPPLAPKNSREERKERMREKREQQRLKKMAQNKLGEYSFSSYVYTAEMPI